MTNSVDIMKIARAYTAVNEAVGTEDQFVKRQTIGAVRRSINRLLVQFGLHNLLKSCQSILSVNAWESANSVLVMEIEKVADRFGIPRDDVAYMFNSELVNRRSRLGREEQWDLYRKSTNIDDLPESSNKVCEDEDGVVDADDPTELGLNTEPEFGEDHFDLEKWQDNLREIDNAYYSFIRINDGHYTNQPYNKWVDTPMSERDHYGFGGFYGAATNYYGIPGRSGRRRLSRASFAGYNDDPEGLIMSLVREVRGHESVKVAKSSDPRFLEVTVGHHDGDTTFLVGMCREAADDARGEYDIQSDPRCYIPLSEWLPTDAIVESSVCEDDGKPGLSEREAAETDTLRKIAADAAIDAEDLRRQILKMSSMDMLRGTVDLNGVYNGVVEFQKLAKSLYRLRQ